MLHHRTRAPASCVVLLMLVPTVVAAGNLLVNRDFDVDLSGWVSIGTWDPADGTCLPASGSVQWTNAAPSTAGSMFVYQCVDLPAGGPPALEVRAWFWIPTGQTGTGYAQLGVWRYDGPGCVGTPVSSFAQQFDVVGPWMESVLPIPADRLVAGWVRVWAANQKVGAGDFQTYADHLWFGPPLVFEDGFEHGTTAIWSAAVP